MAEEIIEDDKNGLKTQKDNLSEFIKAIIKIIKEPNLRKKLGENALHDSKKYSYLETSKIMLSAYKQAQIEHKRKREILK